MKNRFLTLIIFVLLSYLLTIAAYADDNLIIADFDIYGTTGISWEAGDAVEDISIVPDLDVSANRENILTVIGENTDASIIRTATAVLDKTLDLSIYKSITLSIYVDPISIEGNNSCFVRATLFDANGESYESILALEAGEWANLSLDISDYSGRSNIKALELGIIPDHVTSGVWDGGFSLDAIYASEPVNAELVNRFSFETCTFEGGNIDFFKDNSRLDFEFDGSTDVAFIEFSLALPLTENENSMRINIANHSEADNFTVILLNEENIPVERTKKNIREASDGLVFYVDIAEPTKIKSARLEFPNTEGYVSIKSIEFTSTYNSASYMVYGDITQCRLNSINNSIEIAGELSREYVTEFSENELLLYSLNLSENALEYDYENAEPIARHGVSTKFRFNVNIDENTASSKFQKYVVMISSSPMLFVDTPTYITENDPVAPGSETLKIGISANSVRTAIDCDSDATVLDIYLDEIISSERSGYMYVSGNEHYYFSKDRIDPLDRQLGALRTAGVCVSLRLLLKSDYFPTPGETDKYSAMRAAIEFLSERYVSTGSVDSFILGKAVNTGENNIFSSKMSMTGFVNSYADLMRFAYLSSDNTANPVTIYASVGDVYEYGVLKRNLARFDSVLFTNALAQYISDEGEFPWGICIESSSFARQNDDKLLDISSFDSSEATFSNLPQKSVMIIDHVDYTNASGNNNGRYVLERIIDAAKYEKLCRYIISLEEKSPHTVEISAAIAAFNHKDTEVLRKFEADTKKYEALIKEKKISQKTDSNAKALFLLPFTEKGRYTYFDFNSYPQFNAISLSHNTESVKLVPMQTGTLALRANPIDSVGSGPMAVGLLFDESLNLSYTPALSFDIMIAGAKENVNLSIRFTGEEHTHTVDTILSPDKWSTIYVDMSDFSSKTSFFSAEISVYADNLSQSTLYVDNITGYSDKHDADKLTALITDKSSQSNHSSNINPTIVTVFVLIITVLTSITVILALRSRKNDKV